MGWGNPLDVMFTKCIYHEYAKKTPIFLSISKPLSLTYTHSASLLIHHPLLLSCPLSEETVDVAQEAMKIGLSSRWLAKSLSYNMVSVICTRGCCVSVYADRT